MTDQFEEQKKNCPFCKIIKGEIPSKKIYENDVHEKDLKVSAILDINPLTQGHTLVLPNEHYPILPLIPPNTFDEIFKTVVDISDIQREVLLKSCSTIFVANGAAAGQQSSHFMVHVVPRDEGEANNFDLKGKEVSKEKLESLRDKFAQVISIMFKDEYMKFPLLDKEGKPIQLGYSDPLDMAVKVMEQNPQLKEVLFNNKDEFVKIINNDERAKSIFSSVNLDDLIVKLGGKIPEKIKEPEVKESTEKEKKSLKPIDVALAVMNESPKLCELLINNKEEFIKVVNADKKAKLIFEPVDLDELSKLIKNQIKEKNNESKPNDSEELDNKEKDIDQEKNNEENKKDNADLDKVSELFK